MAVNVGELVATLKADTSQFQSGMQNATTELFKIGSSSVAVGNIAADAFKKIIELAKDAALSFYTTARAAGQYAEDLQRVQTITGLTIDSIQNMNVAVNRVGMGIDDVSGMFRRLSSNIEEAKDGVGSALLKFEEIGVTIKKSDGSEDVIRKISDAYLRMGEGTARASSAVELLGRSGQSALAFLSQGSKSFDEIAEKAARMGKLTNAQVIELAKMDDSFDDLRMSAKMFADQFGAAFGPAMKLLADGLTASISFLTRQFMHVKLEATEFVNQIVMMANLLAELPRAVKELGASILAGTLDEAWKAHKKREAAIIAEADAITALINKEHESIGTMNQYADAQDKKTEATNKFNLKLREAMKPIKLMAIDETLKSSEAQWDHYVKTVKAATEKSSVDWEALVQSGQASEFQSIHESTRLRAIDSQAEKSAIQEKLTANRIFLSDKRSQLLKDKSIDGQVELAKFDVTNGEKMTDLLRQLALAQQSGSTVAVQGLMKEIDARNAVVVATATQTATMVSLNHAAMQSEINQSEVMANSWTAQLEAGLKLAEMNAKISPKEAAALRGDLATQAIQREIEKIIQLGQVKDSQLAKDLLAAEMIARAPLPKMQTDAAKGNIEAINARILQNSIDTDNAIAASNSKITIQELLNQTSIQRGSFETDKVQLGAALSLASSELSIAQSHYADMSKLRALRMQEIQANLALELSAVGLTQEQITAIYLKEEAAREGIIQQFPNAFEKAMQDVINSSSFSMGQLVNQFSGTMADWVMGINTFQQFWKNAMRSLAQAFINEALANMAKAALSSGMGQWFSIAMTALSAWAGGGGGSEAGDVIAGASGASSNFSSLQGRSMGFDIAPLQGDYGSKAMAAGGIVTSPTHILAGEAGPEAIIPLSQFNGGMGSSPVNIAITVNAQGGSKSSGTGDATNFDQLARNISQLVERKIIDEQRPGGLLSGMA